MNFLRIITLLFLAITLNHYTYCSIEEPIRGKVFRPGTPENFEKMLARYDIVLVDFFADWCGPCKQMHKIIDALAQDKDLDEVLFIEVNIDEQHTLSTKYHISSLPTIIIFVDGKPLRTFYGVKDKKSLKNILQEALRNLNNF